MECTCPLSVLTTIVAEACGIDITQIQKMAFQIQGDGFDTGAGVPTDILELADWQTKIAAGDATKIVVTPLIGADPTIEPGEATTTGGGDNSTLNGVEKVTGVNPSNFSCAFNSLSSLVESQLKALRCHNNLVVYFFTQGGFIIAVEVSAGKHEGFGLQSMFVSDRGNAGFGTNDTVNMSFSLPSGWSDKLVKIKPNFNPLTDI